MSDFVGCSSNSYQYEVVKPHQYRKPFRQHRCNQRKCCCQALQPAKPQGYRPFYPKDNQKADMMEDMQVESGWFWDPQQTKENLMWDQFKPTKYMGQNFLTRQDVIERIVKQCDIQKGERILEIGPGTGNLTTYLLQAGAYVTAVEKETLLVEQLKKQLPEEIASGQLTIVNEDIMTANLNTVVEQMIAQQEKDAQEQIRAGRRPTCQLQSRVKVVANLPYSITSSTLKLLLPQSHLFSSLNLMVQKEVADRLIVRKANGKAYRSISVLTHYFTDPTYHFIIHRKSYYPAPKVHGAFMTLTMKRDFERDSLVGTVSGYVKHVRAVFQHRRRKMATCLDDQGFNKDQVEAALAAMNQNTHARAQELLPRQHVQLYNLLHDQPRLQRALNEYIESDRTNPKARKPNPQPGVLDDAVMVGDPEEGMKRKRVKRLTPAQEAMQMLQAYRRSQLDGTSGQDVTEWEDPLNEIDVDEESDSEDEFGGIEVVGAEDEVVMDVSNGVAHVADMKKELEWGTHEYWMEAELSDREELQLLIAGKMRKATYNARRAQRGLR